MKEIPLSQGKVALVDDEDYALVAPWKWSYFYHPRCHTGYAYRMGSGNKGVFMHRLILGAISGQDVDHRNHDGTDNRRDNLRLCTRSENNANARPRTGHTSVYKGVSLFRDHVRWRAQAQAYGVNYHLGLFGTEQEAARAYNAFATEHWGIFARLNDV